MCIFHLKNGHDEISYLNMVHYKEMEVNKETIEEVPTNEGTLRGLGNFVSYYLKYDFDSEYGGDILITLECPLCFMLIRN